MDANRAIFEAICDARALLIYHVKSKQGRAPEETIEDLRKVLEATSVSEAVNKLRNDPA